MGTSEGFRLNTFGLILYGIHPSHCVHFEEPAPANSL